MEEPEGVDAAAQKPIAAYNLGDLKREEETLISLYAKMSDQLHKLEVEELELNQKIRRKELKETTEELFPRPAAPPPTAPAAASDVDTQKKPGKGKSLRRRKRERTVSSSHDETASEFDESMSVTSAFSQSSPVKSTKTTPTSTRKSARALKDSPSKLKAIKNLTIPSFEPEKLTLELDLSALSSFTVPAHLQPSADDFVESEED